MQLHNIFCNDCYRVRLPLRSGAVGDDGKPVVDHWYGTTEPLSRVQADEELIFYDPVNFTELGRSAHVISNTFTPFAFQCTTDNSH